MKDSKEVQVIRKVAAIVKQAQTLPQAEQQYLADKIAEMAKQAPLPLIDVLK